MAPQAEQVLKLQKNLKEMLWDLVLLRNKNNNKNENNDNDIDKKK